MTQSLEDWVFLEFMQQEQAAEETFDSELFFLKILFIKKVKYKCSLLPQNKPFHSNFRIKIFKFFILFVLHLK